MSGIMSDSVEKKELSLSSFKSASNSPTELGTKTQRKKKSSLQKQSIPSCVAKDGASPTYDVEAVLREKNEDKETYYLLKWDDSWVDEDLLSNCKDLISKYHKKQQKRSGLTKEAKPLPTNQTQTNQTNEKQLSTCDTDFDYLNLEQTQTIEDTSGGNEQCKKQQLNKGRLNESIEEIQKEKQNQSGNESASQTGNEIASQSGSENQSQPKTQPISEHAETVDLKQYLSTIHGIFSSDAVNISSKLKQDFLPLIKNKLERHEKPFQIFDSVRLWNGNTVHLLRIRSEKESINKKELLKIKEDAFFKATKDNLFPIYSEALMRAGHAKFIALQLEKRLKKLK